ncbi:hypothetical protein [Bradyrhizobium sp. Bra64]|uniref:hypothetical protein n=1 Tax=Bradyrhizobium sp. Bra64 TaxID=2926009 RepID=UPI00211835DA|nr:hypothetical protein [Bradyrhizobium sp. Bra64]
MATRTLITETRRGALGQNEDWWYFVANDDGSRHIEHEWSYVDAHGKGKDSAGTKKLTVEEFLKDNHNAAAVGKVKELMAR